MSLRRYDETTRALEDLARKRPLCTHELVLHSRVIQLGSENNSSLQEAEQSLLRALELDSELVPALLDMGWFQFAVNDDAAKALTWFERATRVIEKLSEEARDGYDQCMAELESALAARGESRRGRAQGSWGADARSEEEAMR